MDRGHVNRVAVPAFCSDALLRRHAGDLAAWWHGLNLWTDLGDAENSGWLV